MTYDLSSIALYGCKTLSSMAEGYYSETPLVGAYIAPIVTVNSMNGNIIKFDKSSFVIEDTTRALTTVAKTVSTRFGGGGLDSYALTGHALGYEIPVEILAEAGALSMPNAAGINIREIEIANLMRKMALGHELEVVTLATTPGTYETTNYGATITGIIPGANIAWDLPGSTPIADVLSLQSITRRQVGIRFNSAVIGSTTYEKLVAHPDILGRVVQTSADAITTDVIARYFGLTSLIVADAIAFDAAGTLTSIFPENAFLGFYSPVPGSEVYTLQARANKGTPGSFYTYMSSEGTVLSPEKYYDITCNGASANVVRSVATQNRAVLPVGLGLTGKVASAVYVANVFA